MLVRLNYFKRSGKWYGNGEYETTMIHMHDIWDEVTDYSSVGILPGLMPGHSEFIVSIDVPDHEYNHPKLINT